MARWSVCTGCSAQVSSKLSRDEGIFKSRIKLLLKLLFGDCQPKTRELVEDVFAYLTKICLNNIGEDNLINIDLFEKIVKNILLIKEVSEVVADVFDHLVLIKGIKIKV